MNSWIEINQRYKTIDQSFYLFNDELFLHNLNLLRSGFASIIPHTEVAYSFKSNYTPHLCQLALQAGCRAEVVSGMEYEIALTVGFKPTQIIFNGPLKRPVELLKAITDGALVHLDSSDELQTLLAAAQAGELPAACGIGLRIQINDNSRFGFHPYQLNEIIQTLRSASIRIVSLHGHLSTPDRAPRHYAQITHTLLDVAERYQLDTLERIDVGGGFAGAYPLGTDLTNRPSFADYAKEIAEQLNQSPWYARIQPRLVVEPGISVLANTLSFYTRIFDSKQFEGRQQLGIDGSFYHVKPSGHLHNPSFELIRQLATGSTTNEELMPTSIVGSTCMERDIIVRDVELPQANLGDFVRFDGLGAYTVALTPQFIHYLPPIYALNGASEWSCIRQPQRVADLLHSYSFEPQRS